MNIFDDMPDIPPCPHCGHDGEGLQWAFPYVPAGAAQTVQCACLACGVHAPARGSYEEAIEAFRDKLLEGVAA